MLTGSYHAEWIQQGHRQQFAARAGDVIYWGPGQTRWEANAEAPRMSAYSLVVDWTPPWSALPHLAQDRRGLMRILAAELLRIQLGCPPPALQRQLFDGYFLAFVAEYRRSTTPAPSPWAEELRLFAIEHIEDHLRVTDLARHFGLSARQFSSRYRAETGLTPMDEVRRLRAEAARAHMLDTTQPPLKEIARRVGLRDYRELGRLIKRHFGVRPRDLPRAKRGSWRQRAGRRR